MLRKNDEVTVQVERFGGEMGIAHLEGQTLFVQGALPHIFMSKGQDPPEKAYPTPAFS